jgi:hypothetical protein
MGNLVSVAKGVMVNGEFISKEDILNHIQGLTKEIETNSNKAGFIPDMACRPYIQLEKAIPRTEIDLMLKNMDSTDIEFLNAGLYMSKSYKTYKTLQDICKA